MTTIELATARGSLGELKRKLAPVAGDPLLREVLGKTGCAAYLL